MRSGSVPVASSGGHASAGYPAELARGAHALVRHGALLACDGLGFSRFLLSRCAE